MCGVKRGMHSRIEKEKVKKVIKVVLDETKNRKGDFMRTKARELREII